MTDATFEDGGELPLLLRAMDGDGLQIVSSLTQDAIFPATEITFTRSKREFGILLNRFRWEDKDAAEKQGRPYERVQAVLLFGDVLNVGSQGIDQSDKETVLSLLSLSFEPGDDGAGKVVLNFAGDGAIGLDVECIDITLKDVTRPYIAPSKKVPSHPDD
jgi:hypothetical protein